MTTQLEMDFAGPEQSGPAKPAIMLPVLAISEDSTPGQIMAWWHELVAVYTLREVARIFAQPRVEPAPGDNRLIAAMDGAGSIRDQEHARFGRPLQGKP